MQIKHLCWRNDYRMLASAHAFVGVSSLNLHHVMLCYDRYPWTSWNSETGRWAFTVSKQQIWASNLSSSQCTAGVLANLLCSPIAGEISAEVLKQRKELVLLELVCIFHMSLFTSPRLASCLPETVRVWIISPYSPNWRACLLDPESPELYTKQAFNNY